MYRIPLTKSGAIPLVTADERRLPVVDIPLGIEHAPGEIILSDNTVQTVDTYIFYCHSKPGSEKQQTGDGTKENPWDDLNVALKKLCCIIHNSCDNCIACKLIVSGTIDYPITSYTYYDGKHRLLVDCEEAVFLYSEYYEYGRISRLKNMSLVNVDFTDTFKPASPETYSAVPAMYDCFGCRFEKITISTAVRAFSSCEDCVFRDVAVQINSVNFEIRGAVYRCHNSLFDDCNVFVQGNKEDHGYYWGFTQNDDSVFSNCTATFSGTGCCIGCGFSANDNPTWLGSNIGYVLNPIYDVLGECSSFKLTQTENENCTIVPESSVPPSEEPPSGGFKGAVSCKIIPRAVTAETYPYSSEVNQSCLHTWYTLRIGYCNSITDLGAGDNTRATVKRYGNPIMTYQGEHDYDEDGNPTDYCAEMWEYYDCDYNDAHVSELPKVCRDASADIDKLIDGTLGLPPVKEKPYPFPTDGWLGYTQWSLQRNWRGDSEYTLSKSGDTFPVDTEYSTGWYNIWGDTPCGGMNVTTSIMLHCVVFSWIPDSEHSKSPTKVRLKSPDGTVNEYDFGVEYCLQGKSDIDIPGLHYSTCEVAAEMDSCKYIVPDRVNAADPESNANFATSVKVERRYTYEGVK